MTNLHPQDSFQLKHLRPEHQVDLFIGCDCHIEVVNFYLKTQLGLADFRVRSYEACDKYVVAVHLAWAYVERRFVLERSAQVKTYGDLIRRHRDEHAAATLKSALMMMQAGDSIDEVIARFIRQEQVTA